MKIKVKSSFTNIDERIDNRINEIHDSIHQKKCLGNEYLGWLDLPTKITNEEIDKINDVASRIQKNSECLIVIGIGGSYLGSKAGIDFLKKEFKKTKVEILYAGHNLSGSYLKGLLEYVKDKDYSINVISKSGKTLEPAIAFRVLKEAIEQKYGIEESKKRIIVTTDETKGALKEIADKNGYDTFFIPADVGGRFSVLTPVGLIPLAVAGFDIKEIIKGASDSYNDYLVKDVESNESYKYAKYRYHLYQYKNKEVEIFVSYDEEMKYIGEWWKQLFGESEGKEGKGLFVSSVNFTTDLHSLGQYIQDGKRILFETVLTIKEKKNDIIIPFLKDDIDELNYVAGKKLSYVNQKAQEGTSIAHEKGNVPNILIEIPRNDEYNFGYLIYFFEKACAVSALLIDVNPFDQPGVEEYKKSMFSLLKK